MNASGKIDSEEGSYLRKSPTRTIPMYKTESHLLLGVAQVPLESGEMVGRQQNSFVYTNKRVVSYADWKNSIEWEIFHIKRGGNKKVWVKKVACDEG
eukprot:3503452-Ditylum_brightwellii.AAC.1